VTSGATSAQRTFTVRITEPVLTKQQVLALAFQGPQPPSDNLRSYLDLQGNKNGTFDIGDVLRWLVRTGNASAPARAALAVALALAASYCGDGPTGPVTGRLLVTLAGAGPADRALLVEVTGADTSAVIDSLAPVPGAPYQVFV